MAAILYGGGLPQVQADAADPLLDEIVVTARKRVEHLQDVPQNIDVFTAKDVQNLGIARLEDYIKFSPSISLISQGPDQARFFIRGVSDGTGPQFGNGGISTNGYLIDDLSMDFYGHAPDLHLYDIERIEVLNGPQGTLFGASAMSGLVRVVTKKPDPSAFSAGVDVDVGHIETGGNNFTYEGFANLPLIEGKTALRISAYSEYDGGYINNLEATRHWVNGVTSTNAQWAGNNYNRQDVVGARAAVLENFNDDWKASVTGTYQRQKFNGLWEENPALGENNLEMFSPQGGYEYDHMLDLHVDGDVGIADLVYAGGYSSQQRRRYYDFSDYVQYYSYVANFIQGSACATSPVTAQGKFSGCNVPTMYGRVDSIIQIFSNELRLQSKPGGRAHWTVGAYWEKTLDPYSGVEHLPGINFSGQQAHEAIVSYGSLAKPIPGVYYADIAQFDYVQTSEFGDLTYDVGHGLSLEGGLVHFRGKTHEYTESADYYYQPVVPFFHSSSVEKTSFKAALDFKATDHALAYFSFAQGFRDGGFNYVNAVSSAAKHIPETFLPDTLDSYELGLKSSWLENRIVWNSALYYMPWKNYQISVPVKGPPYGFDANVGNVRIYGLESSIEARPMPGLQLSFNGNYNDSKLVSNEFSSSLFVVLPGQRLPEAPYFNWSAVSRYEWPFMGHWSAFLQLDASHKGDMWNLLKQNERTLQPSYTIGNLRAGVGPADGTWQMEGYVSNLWDTHAEIFFDANAWFPQFVPNEPRVFGVRVKYRWGKI